MLCQVVGTPHSGLMDKVTFLEFWEASIQFHACFFVVIVKIENFVSEQQIKLTWSLHWASLHIARSDSFLQVSWIFWIFWLFKKTNSKTINLRKQNSKLILPNKNYMTVSNFIRRKVFELENFHNFFKVKKSLLELS